MIMKEYFISKKIVLLRVSYSRPGVQLAEIEEKIDFYNNNICSFKKKLVCK